MRKRIIFLQTALLHCRNETALKMIVSKAVFCLVIVFSLCIIHEYCFSLCRIIHEYCFNYTLLMSIVFHYALFMRIVFSLCIIHEYWFFFHYALFMSIV